MPYRDVVRFTLPDGQELLVTAGESRSRADDVGIRAPFDVTELRKLIAGTLGGLGASLRAAGPDEVTVEFSLDVSIESGKLLGLVASGGTAAAFTVSATWKRHDDAEPAAPAEPTASGQ